MKLVASILVLGAVLWSVPPALAAPDLPDPPPLPTPIPAAQGGEGDLYCTPSYRVFNMDVPPEICRYAPEAPDPFP